jgi:hypothetical protein
MSPWPQLSGDGERLVNAVREANVSQLGAYIPPQPPAESECVAGTHPTSALRAYMWCQLQRTTSGLSIAGQALAQAALV